MLVVKPPQFLQDRIGLLKATMPHRLVSRHTRQHQTAESLSNLDATGALVNAARLIQFCLATVVTTVASQAVGDPHQHTSQSAIGLADDWTISIVRLIALVT